MKTKTKTLTRRRIQKVTRPDSRTASTAGRKPKTAYELMERVAEHILEEPKRYNQGWWGFENNEREMPPGELPACGTVCCRAGWIVALHDGIDAMKNSHVGSRAEDILDTKDTNELFYDISMERFAPGTEAYAKAGVAGMRKWMKQHKAHLQARVLKDVPRV